MTLFKTRFGGNAFVLPRGLSRVPLPSLLPAFARRRAVFGPVELREDCIRADSYLADDLSAEARRALREEGRT